MNISQAIEIGRDLFYTTLLLALPALLTSLTVGLVVSILQTITSIQEQTLTFTPRLIGVGLALIFAMAWIMQTAVYFTVRMLAVAAGVTH
ncbi:MAG TPA: flagellar biosynthetic protein FliQ [Gemmataceae bacterium]|nr:flagellar biosynthetic protein FliQ [Gemmataceae bacterium]